MKNICVLLLFLAACRNAGEVVPDPAQAEVPVAQTVQPFLSFSPQKEGFVHPTSDGELQVSSENDQIVVTQFGSDGSQSWQKRIPIPGIEDVVPDFSGNRFRLGPSFVAPDGTVVTSAWLAGPKVGSVLMHLSPQGELLHHHYLDSKEIAVPNEIVWDEEGNPYVAIYYQESLSVPGQPTIRAPAPIGCTAIVAYSKDFSRVRWMREFQNLAAAELNTIPGKKLLLAGSYRGRVRSKKEVLFSEVENIGGFALEIERETGAIGWAQSIETGYDMGDPQAALLFGDRILVHFEGTGWNPGVAAFLSAQDGTLGELVQLGNLGWILEDTSPEMKSLTYVELETHRRRSSAQGAHQFFHPAFHVYDFHPDGKRTKLHQIELNPRYKIRSQESIFLKGYVRDDIVTLDFRLAVGFDQLHSMRARLGPQTPSHLVIDQTADILAEKACESKPFYDAFQRAVFPCVSEGDEEVLLVFRVLVDGTPEFVPEESKGVTAPSCVEESLKQLSWCPGEPIYLTVPFREAITK